MTPLLACLVWVQNYAFLEDQPEWKAYQAKLGEAYAIEVRWARTTKDAKDTKVGKFHLLFMRPGRYLLEEEGVTRTVWNGSEGIRLDLRARTYARIKERPKFEAAAFLSLPGLTPAPDGDRIRSSFKRSAEKDRIQLSEHLNLIDAHRLSDWIFSAQTKLLRALYVKYDGMWKGAQDEEYRIQVFDTGAVLISANFPVAPPAEFKEYSG